MRFVSLVALLTLLSCPVVWAEPAIPPGSAAPPSIQAFDFASGFAALHQALSLAESYVDEHLDLDGRYHPGTEDSPSWGRMHFKFYPQGRSRPQEGVEADTWITSKDGELSFQFRFNDVTPHVSDPDQHL